MSDETTFALLDGDGLVTNVIVADQAFIDGLPAQIADPDVDTGDLTFDKAVDVTNVDGAADGGPGSAIGIGWKKARNGRWVAPVPTAEEAAAQAVVDAAAAKRATDDAYLAGLRTKVEGGQELTADERDRLALIQLSRS